MDEEVEADDDDDDEDEDDDDDVDEVVVEEVEDIFESNDVVDSLFSPLKQVDSSFVSSKSSLRLKTSNSWSSIE